MKKLLFTLLSLFTLCSINTNAQVSIGNTEEPQDFSILELDANEGKGLRVPILTTDDRDKLNDSGTFEDEVVDKARGLLIYNTTNRRLEYWNGEKWIEL